MVFDKMAAICPDFKWLGFWISDPIQNPDQLGQGSYLRDVIFNRPLNVFLVLQGGSTAQTQGILKVTNTDDIITTSNRPKKGL